MPAPSQLVRVTRVNRVTTLTFHNPAKLNGWTLEMLDAMQVALRDAAADDDTGAIVITGTDPYYSAGVNLGGSLRPARPRVLHAAIVKTNQVMFDAFINVPKPILAAVNGPAIGAAVTTASLCDALLASDKATFSTPFARLGVPAEGCSSVQFPRLLGEAAAERILGAEGWSPTGEEAVAVGLATELVPHDQLMPRAQSLAESWVAEGRVRTFRAGASAEELREINARESVQVADAFLAPPFLKNQYAFARSKGKTTQALMFWACWRTHPVWSRWL